MSLQQAPPPYQDEIVYPQSKGPNSELAGLLTPVWQQYFNLSILQPINQSPQQFTNAVALDNQSASIGTSAMALPDLATGYYRASIFAKVTQAATVNSSLIVTMTAEDFDGVSYSIPTTAMTGNTVNTAMGPSITLQVNQGTPISYSTTYASTGATSMVYKLGILIEAMPS